MVVYSQVNTQCSKTAGYELPQLEEADVFQLPLEMCPRWGPHSPSSRVKLQYHEAMQLGYSVAALPSLQNTEDEDPGDGLVTLGTAAGTGHQAADGFLDFNASLSPCSSPLLSTVPAPSCAFREDPPSSALAMPTPDCPAMALTWLDHYRSSSPIAPSESSSTSGPVTPRSASPQGGYHDAFVSQNSTVISTEPVSLARVHNNPAAIPVNDATPSATSFGQFQPPSVSTTISAGCGLSDVHCPSQAQDFSIELLHTLNGGGYNDPCSAGSDPSCSVRGAGAWYNCTEVSETPPLIPVMTQTNSAALTSSSERRMSTTTVATDPLPTTPPEGVLSQYYQQPAKEQLLGMSAMTAIDSLESLWQTPTLPEAPVGIVVPVLPRMPSSPRLPASPGIKAVGSFKHPREDPEGVDSVSPAPALPLNKKRKNNELNELIITAAAFNGDACTQRMAPGESRRSRGSSRAASQTPVEAGCRDQSDRLQTPKPTIPTSTSSSAIRRPKPSRQGHKAESSVKDETGESDIGTTQCSDLIDLPLTDTDFEAATVKDGATLEKSVHKQTHPTTRTRKLPNGPGAKGYTQEEDELIISLCPERDSRRSRDDLVLVARKLQEAGFQWRSAGALDWRLRNVLWSSTGKKKSRL